MVERGAEKPILLQEVVTVDDIGAYYLMAKALRLGRCSGNPNEGEGCLYVASTRR